MDSQSIFGESFDRDLPKQTYHSLIIAVRFISLSASRAKLIEQLALWFYDTFQVCRGYSDSMILDFTCSSFVVGRAHLAIILKPVQKYWSLSSHMCIIGEFIRRDSSVSLIKRPVC